MNRLLSSLLVLSALPAAPVVYAENRTEGPVWHTDVKQARQLSRQSNRPLFVVFR